MSMQMIAGGVEAFAPAKLNLFLEVLGRRRDGYHEIETLMVVLDLGDRLSFEDDPRGMISLRCDEPTIPVGDGNLVVRAARRLKEEAGGIRGARIALQKAIPAEAGLGGGSSDAAATLSALDRLWNLETPEGKLETLAGELGGDVAFFLHPPAAICRGRGEIVEPLSVAPAFHFVLVRPPFGLSTPLVYRNVVIPPTPRCVLDTVRAFQSGDVDALGSSLFNRLQKAAELLRPELASVLDQLGKLAPRVRGVLLSGSGSTCFGLCRDLTAAHEVADIMEPLGLGWVRVATCGSQTEKAS